MASAKIESVSLSLSIDEARALMDGLANLSQQTWLTAGVVDAQYKLINNTYLALSYALEGDGED